MTVANKNYLALFVLFISLSSTVGFLSTNSSLWHFGQATGLAPMPIPFRDVGQGNETMHVKHRLFIYTNGVKREDFEYLRIVKKKTYQRPHRAVIPYFVLANYASQTPLELRKSILGYLCRYYPGADALLLEVTLTNSKQANTFASCTKKH